MKRLFNDPKLQLEFDQSEETIMHGAARLDSISEDIKTLDAALAESGIRAYVSVRAGDYVIGWKLAEPRRWRVCVAESGDHDEWCILIEAKGAVRLAVASYLPALVRALAAVAV